MKTGVLILNLGTPDEPTPEAVGRYLREFLMDRWVIDIPFVTRWLLVNVLIVPKRSHASAEAYSKIWTERGSPLLVHSRELAERMAQELGNDFRVRLAMRYGNPSVAESLEALLEEGVERVIVAPLYPQYSDATTRSSIEAIEAEVRRWEGRPSLRNS